MKRLLLASSLLVITIVVFAQDVIVKKDGSTILSKVIEVGTSEIKYKKWSNQEGPTYSIAIADLLSVNYQNGEKEDFSNVSSQKSSSIKVQQAENSFIENQPDSRNAELISMYNRFHDVTDKVKQKNKPAKDYTFIFGVKPSSVLSNKDVEITFMRQISATYHILIKNKSNKIIYIDKGNSFRVNNSGEFHTYYNASEQTSVTSGGGAGLSLGLGSVASALGIGGVAGTLANGIGVGGGSSHSSTTTYTQQRIIAIPPQGVVPLSVNKSVQVKSTFMRDIGNAYKTIDECEAFYWDGENLNLNILKGEIKTFNESDSPMSFDYVITYSSDERFSQYSSMKFGIFVHEIIGEGYLCGFLGEDPGKYITDFSDESVIIGNYDFK